MTFAARELSPARFGARLRFFLARHPWVRWLCVAVAAAVAAVAVRDRLEATDDARSAWADLVAVPVADATAAPGEAVSWRWQDLPSIAVPDDVAAEVPVDAEVRRQVGRGEIIVQGDLAEGRGPAAGADPGDVVVPISDPLVAHAEVGLAVAVYSDGLVLAASGRIVEVDADVVFVAVAAEEAPMVAAAAQTRQASLAFIRSID